MSGLLPALRALLVLLAVAGVWLVLAYLMQAWRREGWRMAGLQAAIVTGVLVWLITESLSLIHAISFTGVVLGWGIVALGIVLLLVRAGRTHPDAEPSLNWRQLKSHLSDLGGVEKTGLVWIGVSAAVLALVAFAAAPNTWDGLTYHLSRVMHWQQDRSLAFYPTAIERQLAFGPFAEMEILTLQILAGSDRLANIPQYAAMIGCLLGGSLLAKQLGGGRGAQLLAALLMVTLPMGILQATSTQNDYVVTFWCVTFVVLVLTQVRQGTSGSTSVMTGAALGLAILTKATALVYLPAFGLWLAVASMQRGGREGLKTLVVIAATALIILAPQTWRNYRLFGDPLGTSSLAAEGSVNNERPGTAALASNLLRNAGTELASPFPALNNGLRTAIVAAHQMMGLDPSDPGTTWPATGTQFGVTFSLNEDSASSPLDVILIVIAAVELGRSRERRGVVYLGCLAAGVLSFCLLLKWQPWNNRLLMPLLILALPLAAVMLERLQGAWPQAIGLLVAVVSIPYLIVNPSRPLLGANSVLTESRLQQYFTNVPDSYQAYDAVGRRIAEAQCKQVGLVTRVDGREYLAWVMVREYSPETRIEHVLVRNASRVLETDFTPCAIIVFNSLPTSHMTYQNTGYDKAVSETGLDLFLISGSQ